MWWEEREGKQKKMQRAILALTEGKKTMARIFMQILQATPPLSRHLHFSFSTEKDPVKDVEIFSFHLYDFWRYFLWLDF